MLLDAGCTSQLDRNQVDAAQKRYLLAADYYAKGMIPAAQEELRQALALDPQNHEALYLTGLISMRQAVETQDLATRWECLPPNEARVHLEDVDARMRSAEAQYRKAVQARPDYSEAWNALAAVALHFKRWDEAIAHSERALRNAAYSTPWLALVNQGVAYLEKKEYLRAGKVLREALAQNAKLCVARWRLGQVYFSQQDLERARQELQAVVDDQNCPIQEAYLLLGQILVKLDERARAEDIFAACRDMAPRSCVARECRLAD
ncbi:MAG: tetratricopeptide repeat protein [Myxococcales bacterium]|nr:tetratricopeptide repeat protein [Myxococcales bacterium]